MIIGYKGMIPDVAQAAFVAENATLVGDVSMGEGSSAWFGAVIRGDMAPIVIGERSNVQDNAVLHVDADCPLNIGNGVTVGHGAILHGATIEDDVLIGMHATVLNGAVVGEGSLVAAGALVKEHAVIPPRSLVVGVPGKVVRTLDEDHVRHNRANSEQYVEDARRYANL